MARALCGFRTGKAAACGLLAGALVLSTGPSRAEPTAEGLVRIAEILGSVHHLRAVCGAREGLLWRDKMIELLDTAPDDAPRREILVSHFNDAYHRSEAEYPHCSPAAAVRADALLEEGRRLAARLAGIARNAAAY